MFIPGFKLLTVQFYDQLFADRDLNQFVTPWRAVDFAFQGFAIYIHPRRGRRMGRGIAGGENRRILFAGLADRYFIALFYDERWDVDFAAIDFDVAVTDDLTGLCAACAEAHAVDDAVEPALERTEENFARDAFHLYGFGERVAELSFEHTIDAAHFLLLAQLQAVAYCFFRFSRLAVLPGDEIALFNRALFGVAALALQE